MDKGNNKLKGIKLGSLTGLIKDTKFLLLTLLTLVVLGIAFVSGDSKSIALSFYENVTGKKFQTFSPIQDYSHETYLILKDTISRKTGIKLEKADISVFEESDTFYKYRVELKDDTYFYNIEKKPDGIWRINKEK